jgi:glycosyltransferase involved in cell wall biosynthesis
MKITDSKEALVSIVIPSYNRESLISETLNSVKAQTYTNWECIVVDDGSTDNTISVVESYVNKDNRFKLIKRNREPKGAPTCRNIGLENAKGEYVIFLDSDDILFPHAIQSRSDFLTLNPDLDFCVSPGLIGEFPINMNAKYYFISTKKDNIDLLKEFFNFTSPWVNLNATYLKKSLVDKKVLWDEMMNVYQDVDFNINCLLKDLKFMYIDRIVPDNLWRTHDQVSIGKSSGDSNKLKCIVHMLNKYKSLCSVSYYISLVKSIFNFYIYNSDIFVYHKEISTIIADFKLSWYTLKILKYYRYVLKKNIRIIPSILYILLKNSSASYLLKQNENTHFITDEFNVEQFLLSGMILEQ